LDAGVAAWHVAEPVMGFVALMLHEHAAIIVKIRIILV
jgi:hypothetical protein